jgi:hypothetical protein
MINLTRRLALSSTARLSSVAVVAVLGLTAATGAKAGEVEAKNLLKAMSDYMVAQKAISFAFDTNFEVVTKDQQKLSFASSGTVQLNRPDKIRATRDGGFANVEMLFDGKTLTLLAKNDNVYAQAEVPGDIDHLVVELQDNFRKPMPGADLLLSNVYDVLMADVIDVKDLGSGFIGGTECDHLAFRNKDVDWQIWIAQGASPYPCRYVITTKDVDRAPQYSVEVSNWLTGSQVAADEFGFDNATNARKVEAKELVDTDELPQQFSQGGNQ